MAGLRKIGTIGTSKKPKTARVDAPLPGKVAGRPPSNPARTTTRPRGPEVLRLGQQPKIGGGGPGEPPEFFVSTPTVSKTEWVLYWASAKLFTDPVDPRQPPYTGARNGDWEYQVPELAGAPRSVGNSVTDFVYHLANGDILLRLDTFYFHIAADPAQQARDLYQRIHASHQGVEVRTIYDSQLLGDPTGAAAVQALADVLAGREVVSPVRSGLAFAPRDEVFA